MNDLVQKLLKENFVSMGAVIKQSKNIINKFTCKKNNSALY